MNDPKKKEKNKTEIEAPYVPEFEVPDPPVPNRAHTEMSLGNFGPLNIAENFAQLGNFDVDNDTL